MSKSKQCLYSLLLGCLCFMLPQDSAAQAPVIFLPLTTPGNTNSHPDSAFLLLKEKMLLHRENENQLQEAICLQKMGQILYHLGNLSQSVEHLLRADYLFRSQKSPQLLASNLNILGSVYYYNQQPNKAWTQFNEALDIYKNAKNETGLAETYGLIGHMYEKKQQHDSAYFFQRKALPYALSSGDTAVLSKIHENLGSIYEDMARFDSARHYFQLSLEGYESLGNLVDQIEVINNLGDVWSKSGNYNKGMVYAKKAAEMALSTGEKYQLQSAYRDIAQNFAGLNQHDSAYLYLEQSRQLVQSIYAMENSYQITLMQTLYDMEKKNAEIAQLNAAKKVNTLLNLAVIAMLILIGLLAALVINRQKMKLKRQQLEEDSLKQQLDIKSRELSSHILHLIQKNEVMEELKQGLTDITRDEKRDQKKQVRQLLQKINMSFTQDSYWEEFRLIFDKVHPSFVSNLQQICPTLTPGEIRLLTLVKMSLTSGDMSKLLGITPDSLRVIRYRVKKKLNLEQGSSLSGFVQTI